MSTGLHRASTEAASAVWAAGVTALKQDAFLGLGLRVSWAWSLNFQVSQNFGGSGEVVRSAFFGLRLWLQLPSDLEASLFMFI